VRIPQRQQAGLDPDAKREELLEELADSLLPLVGRHEVRELRPGGDERVSPLGVRLYGR